LGNVRVADKQPNTDTDSVVKETDSSIIQGQQAESIRKKYRLRRICTSQFVGWQVYVETHNYVECGPYRGQCTPMLHINMQIRYQPQLSPPSNVRQLLITAPLSYTVVLITSLDDQHSDCPLCCSLIAKHEDKDALTGIGKPGDAKSIAIR
jgi:hypothetical protein